MGSRTGMPARSENDGQTPKLRTRSRAPARSRREIVCGGCAPSAHELINVFERRQIVVLISRLLHQVLQSHQQQSLDIISFGENWSIAAFVRSS